MFEVGDGVDDYFFIFVQGVKFGQDFFIVGEIVAGEEVDDLGLASEGGLEAFGWIGGGMDHCTVYEVVCFQFILRDCFDFSFGEGDIRIVLEENDIDGLSGE